MRPAKARLAISAVLLVFGLSNSGTRAQNNEASPHNGDPDERVLVGFKIAPVPLKFSDDNYGLVGLGSYLVNAVAGCNDCHTFPNYAPGGDPFRGQPKQVNTKNYLAGGRQFPIPPPVNFTFVSRNLTPETNGLPAGLTFDEFLLVMRTGIDLDHTPPQFGPLLQVMPWPVYQDMTDRDLLAIYEYLRAIPHAEPATP
jgi:hypothetical protein